MAKRKEKPTSHPLDRLFEISMREMSFKLFTERAAPILQHMPYPWAWPDPKTGQEWTLMGRKAHLLWNAPPTHTVKNHTLGTHAIDLAIKHDQVWNESETGKPDILMMWLATCRYREPDGRTQDLIARALKDDVPGLGIKGDGGYLDKLISLVEDEVQNTTDPLRIDLIHRHIVQVWWKCTLLRTQKTHQADWRPISSVPLTTCWPTDTLERVLRLSNQTRRTRGSQIAYEGARCLIQQLQGQAERDESTHRIPQSFLDAVIEDAIGNGVNEALPVAALCVIEHCLAEGLCASPTLLQALSNCEYNAYLFEDLPLLKSAIQHERLETTTQPLETRDMNSKRPRL